MSGFATLDNIIIPLLSLICSTATRNDQRGSQNNLEKVTAICRPISTCTACIFPVTLHSTSVNTNKTKKKTLDYPFCLTKYEINVWLTMGCKNMYMWIETNNSLFVAWVTNKRYSFCVVGGCSYCVGISRIQATF